MRDNLVKRLYKANSAILALSMAVSLIYFAGCNSTVLSSDSESIGLLQKVFPETAYYHYDNESEIYATYDSGKNKLGYAFIGEGEGCNNLITILIGLENKGNIKGISVISHKEQRCVGEFAVSLDFSSFTSEFSDLNVDECKLKREGGQVDSISGATISSRAVVDIVRETALEKTEYIK